MRVSTTAMACEFTVIMNPGPHQQVLAVGPVLDLIHEVEGWLSTYKASSEASQINNAAANEGVSIRPDLFELLKLARQLQQSTQGAFDIAAGAAMKLWKRCRSEKRLPTDEEISAVLPDCGSDKLVLDEDRLSVSKIVKGVQIDPGAIGKGFALDQAAEWMGKLPDTPSDFLIHGGHSSLVTRGQNAEQGGWSVGIGNPLFTKKRLGTILLSDQAMSTSGSNIQFFRHDGRRYGHILDPRTAWPVDGMLSVTVFSPTAAVADALSTAFFVLGVEKALECCDNFPDVGAILIPWPKQGRVRPVMINVPEERVFWDKDQVELV